MSRQSLRARLTTLKEELEQIISDLRDAECSSSLGILVEELDQIILEEVPESDSDESSDSDDEECNVDDAAECKEIINCIAREIDGDVDMALKNEREDPKIEYYIGPEIGVVNGSERLFQLLYEHLNPHGIHVQQYSSGNIRFRIQPIVPTFREVGDPDLKTIRKHVTRYANERLKRVKICS